MHFKMITVDGALKVVLKSIKVLPKENTRLTDGLGRVLAEDVYSDTYIPMTDNSAMDGYAVKACDLKGASKSNPIILEVADDIKAGDVPKIPLRKNQAIRIMTGAIIPKGADSVVMVEYTRKVKSKKVKGSAQGGSASGGKSKEFVEIFREVRTGENIRRAGEDVKKGELVIQKGTHLNSAHIGMLASVGRKSVKVIKKPKVAILATGDELIDVGEKLKPGRLRSSNTYTLYSQVLRCGGIPKNLGIAKDKPKELEEKLRKGLDCNLILTSGGVSVGDYDFVKDVLATIGTKIRFWKVAMRPGKPLVFGMIGKSIPVFGLPGNPVSSMVSFQVFVRPAILKMLGQVNDGRNEVGAILDEDIEKKKGLRYFLRAKTQWRDGAYHTEVTGPQGSGILKSMVLANSLIILTEEEESLKKGSKVLVRFLG